MKAWMAALLLPLTALVGCLGGSDESVDEASAPPAIAPVSNLITLHDSAALLAPESLAGGLVIPAVLTHAVGQRGPEPTLGVTSDGSIFFVAGNDVLRSQDHGNNWEIVHSWVQTLDPMLWVDSLTDRVFVDHLYVGCSYLAYSDDLGETWVHNPIACGLPGNDHQKVATAPPRSGGTLQPTPLYPNLVYYAYNNFVIPGTGASRVSVSLDGGLTWPINSEAVPDDDARVCSGGLHGHLTSAPNGTLYLPKRSCDGAMVAISYDSGLTWFQQLVGGDAGSTECRKNPEVATDLSNNAYLVWPAADEELYLSHSLNEGRYWSPSIRISPPEMEVVTMPVIAAGSPGRIAVAYYGIERDQTENAVPDQVSETGRWHLYVTMTANALDANPTFVTVQVTPDDDPIQVGPISTNSGCDNPPGSRNLLDFIDLVMDKDGRVFVAYADGCTEGCAGKADAEMTDSRDAAGMVAIVHSGISLFEEIGLLPAPGEEAPPEGGTPTRPSGRVSAADVEGPSRLTA